MTVTMKAHHRLGDSIQVFQVRPADVHLCWCGCLWAHDGLLYSLRRFLS